MGLGRNKGGGAGRGRLGWVRGTGRGKQVAGLKDHFSFSSFSYSASVSASASLVTGKCIL